MKIDKIYNSTIARRGRKQIEIRTDYSLKNTRKKKQRFCLNAYISTSAQLGIQNDRYSKETLLNIFQKELKSRSDKLIRGIDSGKYSKAFIEDTAATL